MKKINRQIKSVVFEMVVLVSFLFISFNVWDSFGYDDVARTAYAYSNYDGDLVVRIDSTLENVLPYNDDEVSENSNIKVSIININNSSKDYTLYLKYDNNDSTIDKNYLKINYLGDAIYLNELESYEKGTFTYYKLDESKISKKSKDEYNLNLYLSSDTPNSEINKIMNMTFVAEEI